MTKRRHTITSAECHSIVCLRRPKHNFIISRLHRKHKLSYKTLFYMKEYGPRSHVAWVIIKQSIKTLILASMLSSLGGMNLKNVQDSIITILPLLILFPALADMIGDFGTVVSSKFATLLFLGKIKGNEWWKSRDVHELIVTVYFIAVISVFYIAPVAYLISFVKGFAFSYVTFFKVVTVTFITAFTLVAILIAISVAGSFWIYKKKEDPNNFMIPITTSVADLGTLVLFAYLVGVFF